MNFREFDDEEEMLIDSDDEEEICVIAATSIFMRRDLNRNYGFFEVIVPPYSIDENDKRYIGYFVNKIIIFIEMTFSYKYGFQRRSHKIKKYKYTQSAIKLNVMIYKTIKI